MDYIDWIISSAIFFIVLLAVIVTVPNYVNITDSSESVITAESALNNSVDAVTIFEIINNTTDFENTPYLITSGTQGRCESACLVNGAKIYGVAYDKGYFYSFQSTESINNIPGILIKKEDFQDFNYLDTFTLEDGMTPSIDNGQLILASDTNLLTNNYYFDFNGFLNFDSNNLKVYFNYQDEENTYVCDINANGFSVVKINSGSTTIEDYAIAEKNTIWRKANFGSTRNGLVFCSVDEYLANYQDTETTSGKIKIQSIDAGGTNIDNIYIYENKNLISDSATRNIFTYDLNANLNATDIQVDFLSSTVPLASITASYSVNLTVPDTNNIAIITDENQNTRGAFFPQTKEFWLYVLSGEELVMSIDKNLNNYEAGSINGIIKYPEFYSNPDMNYRIPITIIPYENITSDTNIQIDINFQTAFDDQNITSSGDGNTAVQECDQDNNCTAVDYDISYNDISKIATMTLNLSAGDANIPRNFYLYFSSTTIDNKDAGLVENEVPKEYEQMTCQEEGEIQVTSSNDFYIYNYRSGEQDLSILQDVFDENSVSKSDCNIEVEDQTLIIKECENNSIIKIRFREGKLDEVAKDYPQVLIIKSKENIITKEKINVMEDSNQFFIAIENQATNINIDSNRFGVGSIIEKYQEYLNEYGQNELVKFLIKPY